MNINILNKDKKRKNILLIANNNMGKEFSGGDTILIGLAKLFSLKKILTIMGSENTNKLFKKNAADLKFKFIKSASYSYFQENNLKDFLIHVINRTYFALKCLSKKYIILSNNQYVYSASDFYPDFLPALILKLKNPKMVWLAGFYLFAPKPWQSDNPYRLNFSSFIKGFLYWLSQQPSYFFINRYADYVFVTSEPDVKPFINKNRSKKQIIVIKGFVDTTRANKYLNSKKVVPVDKRKYDACFMGRFHYQKGVLELIDIWKLVCQKIPEAKLVMIGDGPLYTDVKTKIKKLCLRKNIFLTGFLTGVKKENIFKQSKIMLHPATYDSGGMSMAEGMAYGLPGISFDLPALKKYYTQGISKISCFDKILFAKHIVNLLTNPKKYGYQSRQAVKEINTNWLTYKNIVREEIFIN